MSKNIFKSKTFWLNALGAVQLIVPIIPVDAETTGLVMTVLNVIVRRFTNQPVTVVPEAIKNVVKSTP